MLYSGVLLVGLFPHSRDVRQVLYFLSGFLWILRKRHSGAT